MKKHVDTSMEKKHPHENKTEGPRHRELEAERTDLLKICGRRTVEFRNPRIEETLAEETERCERSSGVPSERFLPPPLVAMKRVSSRGK